MKIIVTCLALSVLGGCILGPTRKPPRPARPEFEEIVALPDGGICLFRVDALKLFEYIEKLEKGYTK